MVIDQDECMFVSWDENSGDFSRWLYHYKVLQEGDHAQYLLAETIVLFCEAMPVELVICRDESLIILSATYFLCSHVWCRDHTSAAACVKAKQ